MSRLNFAIAALALAGAVTACNSQSFQRTRTLPAPPQPAYYQPPRPPANPARRLEGTWSATYPGGPLRVVIGLDPRILGRNYVATLVTGNQSLPAGQVTWRGVPDPHIPGLVLATQVCASQGFLQEKWIKARIVVKDRSHFTEQLVRPQDCTGFPVRWTRIGPPSRAHVHGD
ncbi:MAG: hypothetical protein ACREQI_00535 [Candidatus Binataceae bacterium]